MRQRITLTLRGRGASVRKIKGPSGFRKLLLYPTELRGRAQIPRVRGGRNAGYLRDYSLSGPAPPVTRDARSARPPLSAPGPLPAPLGARLGVDLLDHALDAGAGRRLLELAREVRGKRVELRA